MSAHFVNVDRRTPMLLPPDLRDWVREDDMVHFVISAVEGMNLSAFRVNERGSGSDQYPPGMMLALLIYCYANGVFGIIKQCMGFRQFLLRGLEKVSGEWELVALAYNVKRLWNLKLANS